MIKTLVRLAITQSELFNTWPDETISRLVLDSDVHVVNAGECVHRAGDTAGYLSLVVSGSMILSRNMRSGRIFTAGVHLPGDFHGLGPVMAQTPYIFTATCKEKTSLVRIPADLLRDIVAVNGRLSLSLFGALEKRYMQALRLHASAAVNSTQARIAGLLKSIDQRSVRLHVHATTQVNLSQDEIATMLGTRRQVVNRVLRDMAQEGAIHVQYGRISIVDRDKLDAMALQQDD
jgi:CRP-like cAMP-binding protein